MIGAAAATSTKTKTKNKKKVIQWLRICRRRNDKLNTTSKTHHSPQARRHAVDVAALLCLLCSAVTEEHW